MVFPLDHGRRAFLGQGWAFLALSLAGCATPLVSAQASDGSKTPAVLPTEDLMREHGVLRRILLIYDEALRRVDADQDVPAEPLATASRIIRNFVEDYHEKLEEDFLFPRFRKSAMHVDLVNVLQQQHKAGRRLTDSALQLATARGLKDPDARRRLSLSLRQFIRMYRPHAAREDTVLFPAMRGVFTPREFGDLGEEFEKREEERYGYTGFARIVEQVGDLEKRFGIYDLTRFTPQETTGCEYFLNASRGQRVTGNRTP
jgi:hemerythrin-like domain-containing protein